MQMWLFMMRHGVWILGIDRTHVQVVEGLDIVKQIENTPTARGDAPKEKVVIADAGEL